MTSSRQGRSSAFRHQDSQTEAQFECHAVPILKHPTVLLSMATGAGSHVNRRSVAGWMSRRRLSTISNTISSLTTFAAFTSGHGLSFCSSRKLTARLLTFIKNLSKLGLFLITVAMLGAISYCANIGYWFLQRNLR